MAHDLHLMHSIRRNRTDSYPPRYTFTIDVMHRNQTSKKYPCRRISSPLSPVNFATVNMKTRERPRQSPPVSLDNPLSLHALRNMGIAGGVVAQRCLGGTEVHSHEIQIAEQCQSCCVTTEAHKDWMLGSGSTVNRKPQILEEHSSIGGWCRRTHNQQTLQPTVRPIATRTPMCSDVVLIDKYFSLLQ